MYNLLVLGLIPGTNVQIGFYAWIILVLAVIAIAYFLHHRILLIIGEQDADFEIRRPLHASQLHFRG